MPAKATKRFFAQIGSELIEIPADASGGQLSTSAPVHFYRVSTVVNDATLSADGDSFKAAEAELDKQLGKDK